MITVDTLPAEVLSRNAMPFLHGDEAGEIERVLRSGQYGHGPESEQFERELAAFLGVPDVVTVASGTAALHIALLTAGIGDGDEVIVPSFTFGATVQAIVACGARPRFIEVSPDTLCSTPEDIAAAITARTRAVVPVLYGGRAIDLTGIRPVLDRHGIAVIEDAAHAFGSRCGQQRVGATGALTCFSFDPIKNLTCGEGGALVPREPSEAARARLIRALGIAQSAQQRTKVVSYAIECPGMRAHLPAMNAAIGRVQLARFDVVEARRKNLWMAYRDAIGNLSGVNIIDVDAGHSVPFNCVVRLDAGRDRVFKDLRARGIGVGVHYPPNHTQPAFAAWYTPLPATEQVAQQVLSLPFHPALDESGIARVISELERTIP